MNRYPFTNLWLYVLIGAAIFSVVYAVVRPFVG